MYPDEVSRLVLVDPIGLEDWKAKGVPWQSVDAWRQQELRTTADSIRNYERTTYYAGSWRPEYERWVDMLAGMYRGPGKDIVAGNSALLDDMIYTQPVVYEFGHLAMPVLLMIGDRIRPPSARTSPRRPFGRHWAIIRRWAKPRRRRYRTRASSSSRISGHAPQIEAPDVFHKALFDGLRALASSPTAGPAEGSRP